MRQAQVNGVVRRIRSTLVALGVVVIAAGARSDDHVPNAGAATPEFFPPPSEAEQRNEAALNKPITVSFDATPLAEGLETLSELAEVPVKFDPLLLTSELDVSEIVLNGEFKEAPLSAILRRFMFEAVTLDGPLNTICYAASDGIILTVRELELYGGLNAVTRIYPIGDLCGSQTEAVQIVELLKSSTGMYWKETTVDGRTGLMVNGTFYALDDDEVSEAMVYAGSISYLDAVDGLVIKAGRATHAEVLGLLRMVRQAKQAMAPPIPEPIPTAAARQHDLPHPAEEQIFTFTVPLTR